MNGFLDAAQVKITGGSLFHDIIDAFPVSHPVGRTDGVHIPLVSGLQCIELTSDTAVKFLVTRFLVFKPVADALGYIVGTQEDHAAFFLQLVVQADKVVEYRFGKLVGFVKYKERSVHLDNVVKDKAPDLTDIAALRAYADRAGYLTDEITFFMSSEQRI